MSFEIQLKNAESLPFVRKILDVVEIKERPLHVIGRTAGMVDINSGALPDFDDTFYCFDSGRIVRNVANDLLDSLERRNCFVSGLLKKRNDYLYQDAGYELEVEIKEVEYKQYIISGLIKELGTDKAILHEGIAIPHFQPEIYEERFIRINPTTDTSTLLADHVDLIVPQRSHPVFIPEYASHPYLESVIGKILKFHGLQHGFLNLQPFEYEQHTDTPINISRIVSTAQTKKIFHKEGGHAAFQFNIHFKPETYKGDKLDQFFVSGVAEYLDAFDHVKIREHKF